MFLRRAVLLFARALRLRCPHCGGGPIFTSWFRMRTRCPVCGLGLERGEHGYIVGAYMFNIIAAELLFAAIAAGVVAATVFFAFDLLFRPAQPEEFSIR